MRSQPEPEQLFSGEPPERPPLFRGNFDGERVNELVRGVKQHYGVAAACLVIDTPSGPILKGRHGVSVRHVEQGCLLHDTIKRQAPTIINDALEDERYRDDLLVKGPPFVRFSVTAPLWARGQERIGSICIMDTQARGSFGLNDCSKLVAAAQEVMGKAADPEWADSTGGNHSGTLSSGRNTVDSLPSSSGRPGSRDCLPEVVRTRDLLPATGTMQSLPEMDEESERPDDCTVYANLRDMAPKDAVHAEPPTAAGDGVGGPDRAADPPPPAKK